MSNIANADGSKMDPPLARAEPISELWDNVLKKRKKPNPTAALVGITSG